MVWQMTLDVSAVKVKSEEATSREINARISKLNEVVDAARRRAGAHMENDADELLKDDATLAGHPEDI